MAILSLSQQPRIVRALPFLRAAERATTGVLRVTGDGAAQVYGTAWLMTGRLALTPGYVGAELQSAEPFVEVLREPGLTTERAKCRIAWRNELFAVLALEQPLGSALELTLDEPAPGADLWLLHHARAEFLSMSWGRLQNSVDGELFYDADTEPGSSGGPIFDRQWHVIGMHSARHDGTSNRGFGIGIMLDALKGCPDWDEIAKNQRLAFAGVGTSGVTASVAPLEDETQQRLQLQKKAAVLWSFEPAALGADARRFLAGDVIDPEAQEWSLRADVRSKALSAASNLSELKLYSSPNPAASPQQKVIDRILDGKPIALTELQTEELPFWLPAVRWFSNVAPSLPSAQQIASELERRRSRARLERIVGPHFSGRHAELALLADWVHGPDNAVYSVSGNGGAGKSALVAKLVLDVQLPFVWLDFDSSAVAPDDAPTLLAELRRQLALQGLVRPDAETTDWSAGLHALGTEVADVPRVLLVLDSFEAAQYENRHTELWPFLLELSVALPQFKIVVSGRLPLDGLPGLECQPIKLAALSEQDAREMLARQDVTDPKIVTPVVAITRCVPLNLVLAIQLIQSGDGLQDLPAQLPQHLVQGNLYRRVLGRLKPSLVRLAHASLVLRRVTADLVFPVLGHASGVTKEGAAAAFDALAKELTLVEGSTVLRHRPDVRNSVLHLLESENLNFVRDIDRAAAKYYRGRDLNDPEIATEFVYHLLRLEQLAEASALWSEEIASRLGPFAVDEMGPTAAAWLEGKQKPAAATAVATITDWEADAAGRIRLALDRELTRAVPGILTERVERTSRGPLRYLEAYAYWHGGDSKAAEAVLESAVGAQGPAKRDLAVLDALLAEGRQEPDVALNALAQVADPLVWEDRKDGRLLHAAVGAAAVRLLIDLDLEREVLASLVGTPHSSIELTAAEVVMPKLQAILGRVEREFRFFPNESEGALARYNDSFPFAKQRQLETNALLKQGLVLPPELPLFRPELRLSTKSNLRWRWQARTRLLEQAAGLLNQSQGNEPLAAPILAALAAFSGRHFRMYLGSGEGDALDLRVGAWLVEHGLPEHDFQRVEPFLRENGWTIPTLKEVLGADKGVNVLFAFLKESDRPTWILPVLHLATPSPLQLVAQRLAAVSERSR